MGAVTIDLSMSLDGFIAGPDDGRTHPLGKRGGEHIFDWYQSGGPPVGGIDLFKPIGKNRDVVEAMLRDYGAMVFGRRTYDITDGWNGSHPIDGVPLFILTHEPPAKVPRGRSKIVFVTDGIASAIAQAQAAAGGKAVGLGGASPGQQALAAGLVDEILVHVAPIVLGEGVRLFDHLGPSAIRLERLDVIDTLEVTHLRYRVIKQPR